MMIGSFHKRTLALVAIAAAALLLLTGCGLFRSDEQPTFDTGQSARLVCNNTCRDHGQCGVTASGDRVVLAGRNTQLVSGHNAFYANELEVEVQEKADRQVFYKNNLELPPFALTFYYVNDLAASGGNLAWVAMYCLENP